MSGWSSGVFALAGVALAGGIAVATERSRWRRDDRLRWIGQRRDLAVRFLEATQDVVYGVADLAMMMRTEEEGGRVTKVGGPTTVLEAMEVMHQADVRVRALAIEIDLIGTDEERVAADALRQAAWKAFSGARSSSGGERRSTPTPEGLAEYESARTRFQEAVRRGLAASSGRKTAG